MPPSPEHWPREIADILTTTKGDMEYASKLMYEAFAVRISADDLSRYFPSGKPLFPGLQRLLIRLDQEINKVSPPPLAQPKKPERVEPKIDNSVLNKMWGK